MEGSVRVWDEGDRAAGVAIAVQPPSFVRVIRAEPGIRNSENMASRVYCDVSLAVDTAQAGEYSGSLTVGVGTRVVELPTSVRVVEPGPNQIRLLVVETPFEKFSTSNADMFKSWLQLVETARLDVDYLEVVRPRSVLGDRDLDRYQVILLGEGGVCFALEDDVDRLLRFIDGGGRVIVCANRYFVPSVQGANELLGPCGLRIDDEEVRRRAGNIDISGGDIRDDGVLKDVRRLRFFRPSPIALIDLKAAKLLVSAPQFPGRGYVASARFGQGEIIAIGQSLWWNWIGDAKFDGFDNAALLQKLLTSGVDTTGEGGSDANPM
ncbi:MAG: hypothetical protein KY476_13645 [Planctomycetes bacterium]|nr:hypothetical protein [Planctomycetota bacterium]